jgi:hypothetical protein
MGRLFAVLIDLTARGHRLRPPFDSGNDLYRFCTAQDDFSKGMCFGLISGYFENLQLACQRKKLSAQIAGRLLTSLCRNCDCESWVGSGAGKAINSN